MPEEIPELPANMLYKQAAQAGIATEITIEEPMTAEMVVAFGGWLKEKLTATPEVRDRVALQSGLPVSEISSLIGGQSNYQMNRNHVQRIASALVELGIISHADEAWKVAGLDSSDYIITPLQVVQTMSRNA